MPDERKSEGWREVDCHRFLTRETTERQDRLVVEEPLEVRVDGEPLATVMRTPGDDVELAIGLLISEGWLARREDVAAMVHCGSGTAPEERNIVDYRRAEGASRSERTPAARLLASSSCGVCGKRTVEEALQRTMPYAASNATTSSGGRPWQLEGSHLATFPAALRRHQTLFEATGALHAAGLFDLEGQLLVVREDIGRHNAVDKVVGWAFLAGRLPLTHTVLQVSGRISFEIVQKAHAAGLECVAAVSGVSSLACEFALETGMTLAGFVRNGEFTAYSSPERLLGGSGGAPRNHPGEAESSAVRGDR